MGEAKSAKVAEPISTPEVVQIVDVFDAPEQAERAYDQLLELGYTKDEINVLMSAETQKLFKSGNPVVATAEGTEVPNATGKVLGGAGAISAAGALSGVIAGVGASLIIPGLGLIVAGPLAALGAGLGAALGAIYGIPFSEMANNEIADHETKIHDGKVWLSVVPHSPEDRENIQRAWDAINNS